IGGDRDDLAVRRIALELAGGPALDHGVKNSVARPDRGAIVCEWTESPTDPWAEIVQGCWVQFAPRLGAPCNRVRSDEAFARSRQEQAPSWILPVEIAIAVLHFRIASVEFITQPCVHGQLRADLPIVLHEGVISERIEVTG